MKKDDIVFLEAHIGARPCVGSHYFNTVRPCQPDIVPLAPTQTPLSFTTIHLCSATIVFLSGRFHYVFTCGFSQLTL